MIQQDELQLAGGRILAQEEVGSMWVAVHIPMDENHFIEGAGHQFGHLLRLEA